MGRRYYSTKEIKDKLRRKGFDESITEAILELLEDEELLNDFRFAKAWVRDRINFRPRGKALLIKELVYRGISNDIIERVLGEEFPRDDIELARRTVAPKVSLYKKMDRNTGIRRAKGYLARRGFPYGTVNEVISEIFDEKE